VVLEARSIGGDVADIEETEDGLRVTIRRSKTDQEGQGTTIAIVRGAGGSCPVRALGMARRRWDQRRTGFRPVGKGGRLGAERLTAKSVCDVVKAYAARIGLDEAAYGAHSLRSGFLTSAARRGRRSSR